MDSRGIEFLEKIAKRLEFAPGIPKKSAKSSLPSVSTDQKWELVIQKHDADRAGTHYDFRLIPQGSSVAYSWAIRNEPMSEGNRLAIRQPDHTAEYARTFSGEIKEGYGKGHVQIVKKVDVEVHKSSPNSVHFTMFDGREPLDAYLVNTGGDNWILGKKKSIVKDVKPLVPPKEKYKIFHKDSPIIKDDNYIATPKIDGAHANIVLLPGKAPIAFSPRESKRGESLEYTHKIRGLMSSRVPQDLAHTVIRGEVYGVNKKTGEVIPVNELSGILNSSHWEAAKKLENVDLKIAAFPNIVAYRGRSAYGMSLKDRMGILGKIKDITGGIIHPVEVAETPLEKMRMLRNVERGQHPLTREGVVLHRRELSQDEPPIKMKTQEDLSDVYIRGFEKGQGRLSDAVGAFLYSHTPTGPVVGKVGTGLDDALRKAMAANPQDYIGRVAKVKAMEKLKSGALRAPSYKGLHQDK